MAETENMRRRTEREMQSARKYGHTSFARDLVGAIDNLARAIEATDTTNKDESEENVSEEALQGLVKGIELSWTLRDSWSPGSIFVLHAGFAWRLAVPSGPGLEGLSPLELAPQQKGSKLSVVDVFALEISECDFFGLYLGVGLERVW